MEGDFYIDPIVAASPDASRHRLAGGWARFSHIRLRPKGDRDETCWTAIEVPDLSDIGVLTAPRSDCLGLALDQPRIMGVLNITPDSFSDGGVHFDHAWAIHAGLVMVEAGADIIDVGGESTRPGAEPIPEDVEMDRIIPVIEGLVAAGCQAPISVDTRKAHVARAAFDAGARIFNDVSALAFDPDSAEMAARLVRDTGGWICLTHSQGEPSIMQKNPHYDDVVLDVFDALAERFRFAVAAGVPADRIIVDPGIGFGKTAQHNLQLLRGLAIYHGLGAPILLGASRKRFIGAISGEATAQKRGPGSIAAAMWGVARGAQIVRVHDVVETIQALSVWRALADPGSTII